MHYNRACNLKNNYTSLQYSKYNLSTTHYSKTTFDYKTV